MKIEYRLIKRDEIKKVSGLQKEVFKGYFLPSLGLKNLNAYFEEIYNKDSYFFGAFDGENLAAVAIFTNIHDLEDAKKIFIKKRFFSIAFHFIWRMLILDKNYWSRFLSVFHTGEKINYIKEKPEYFYTFLDMATNPNYRRKGIMSKLISFSNSFLIKHGILVYDGWILKNNYPALELHYKLGAKIIGNTVKYNIVLYTLEK